MLQAYRRGFLKPDYPNGLQSRIREELVLAMMGREQDADYIDRQTLRTATVAAPHLRANSVQRQLSRIDSIAKYATRRRHYSNAKYYSPEDLLRMDADKMLKVLKDFKNSDTYTLVQEEFKRVLSQAT